MSREENIKIFEDTVALCRSNQILMQSVQSSCQSQRLILDGDSVPNGADPAVVPRFEAPAQIVISKKRTFEAARFYAGKGDKVCVLNFASASNPGGGVVNGSGAQEECLCRVSTLYFCLDIDQNWKKFYRPHRAVRSPIHNDDIIYTRDVMVIKTDTASPKLMPESEWYKTDVITCAAPNLRESPSNRYNCGDGAERLLLSDSELEAVHQKRDRRIFDIAVQNKVDVLILGAFGCGAFRNNPAVVAKVMLGLAREYQHQFKTIEFAVYCRFDDDENYRAFEREMER